MKNGFLLIDKESSYTSRDVCNIIAKIYDAKKVGHAGTLDPFATGLLIVGLNNATKALTYIEGQYKTYEATLLLGQRTSSGDHTDEIIEEKDVPSFNKEKLSKILMMSSRLDEKNMVKPENAHISFSEKDKMFVIVPETEGTAINIKTFWETLCDSLANKREPLSHKDIVVDILKEGLYETAEIKKDSASLNKKTDELNGLTSGSITYRLPDSGTMTLDRSVCRNWLVYEDGEYSYDEDLWYENAGLYVDELAQRANTVWKERVFDSTEHGEITVPGGTYGYSVDIEEETDAILDTIGSGQDEEREPIYASEEDEEYEVNSGIGDTYIEVSIDDQHLWFYKDGKLVLDTDIVTGNRGNHDTPTGVYRILYTQRNATLKGRIMSNGEPEYVTKVSYWMPFYDGCGFHDANWRRSFGGSIYRWNGSHGCVNMPPAKAAELHDYVQAGTIAVIY